MPPRITRLKWPRLFPTYEPLPFLYPRWYSVEVAAAEATSSGTRTDSSTPNEPTTSTRKELGDTLHTPLDPLSTQSQDEDTHVRRVPQSLVRKVQIRKLQETKRKELRAKSFYANDWRTPLMLLRKHTPEGDHHHVKQLARLEIPQGMRGFYPGNLYDLFLDVYLHTGCHVQISRGDNHEHGKFHALEMSGTAATIRLARHILNEAVQVESDGDPNDRGTMGNYNTLTTPIAQDNVMPRSVWSMPHTTAKDLSKILEPEHWSFQSFAAYVAELVIATPTPTSLKLVRPVDLPKNKPHVDLVTEKLMALYTSPHSVRWASMHATVQTLQYLSRHRKVPEVRRILNFVESQSKNNPYLRSVLANPSVFNVLLESASQALDLHTYNFLLRMMTDRGVVPDVETWTSLLQLVQRVSPRNAKHIITTMRQRQMLSSPVAKLGIGNATSQKDVMEWLGRGESVFDFIAHYDKLWNGKEWLDTRACNQILLVLIETGNLQDAMALIKELVNRNKKPNLVTTHILIDAASSYKDLRFAINALETTLGEAGHLQPISRTFEKLAYLAFKVRAYNVLRVVWRYACLNGDVSRDLSRKMHKALSTFLRGKSDIVRTLNVQKLTVGVGTENRIGRQQRFKMFAPIIAVGITESNQHAASLTLLSPTSLTKSLEDLPKLVDTSSSSTDSNTTTSSGLHPTLAADLDANKSYLPVKPFVSTLRKAVEKDLLWKQNGYDKAATLDVLLAKAVPVWIRKNAQLLHKEQQEREQEEAAQKEAAQKGKARKESARAVWELRKQKRERRLLAFKKALEVQGKRLATAKRRFEARKRRVDARRKNLAKVEWPKKNELMIEEAHSAAGTSAEARAAFEATKQEDRKARKEALAAKASKVALAKQKSLEANQARRALWAKKKLDRRTKRLEQKAREERKEKARAHLQARKDQEAREEEMRNERMKEKEERMREKEERMKEKEEKMKREREREEHEEWEKLHQEMQGLVGKK
ncbi:hypothetical protein QM012_002641 [Aureobasidium pullulans]|uniref:Pentatricopeptide repeat protein n=1 Tax=Aureobasidium pullulans TaxID=5580 RepID=A0ABR0TBI8_AURPU